MDKRYGDALALVEKAIAMDPAGSNDFSLYKLRAEIQQAMGFDVVEVQRNLATGYRQARLMRKFRENADPEIAETKAWETLADLAKKGPNEQVRCDQAITICNVSRTIEVHSEWVVGGILTVQNDGTNMKSAIARIDLGREDGIVVGTHGGAWARYSKASNGHERELAKLGSVEVLSVDAHTALVRIEVENPKGDGLVREQDLVGLNARVPLLPKRSSLWSAAKLKISLLDGDNHAFVDYRSLYSEETAESDSKVLQRMVDEIRRAAPLYADQDKPLVKGSFAGQSLQQAMQQSDEASLKNALGYLVKNSRDFSGQEFEFFRLYAMWVQNGAPSE